LLCKPFELSRREEPGRQSSGDQPGRRALNAILAAQHFRLPDGGLGAAVGKGSMQSRTDRDRSMDAHRKPAEMLEFFGVSPGMRVAELGAGGGYSTELFARAVGRDGTVYAQDSPTWSGPGLTKAWQARLARPAMQNTTHFIRPWETPLPQEATDLDAVYSVAIYHDVIAEKHDSNRMNQAVFAALKPGGTYAIIDNSAKPGTRIRPSTRPTIRIGSR